MNPIEELTARLVQQAEADMPRPLAVGKPETLGRGAGAPSMDDKLHTAVAEAVLALVMCMPARAQAIRAQPLAGGNSPLHARARAGDPGKRTGYRAEIADVKNKPE